jgi:hypothetical protein
MRLAGLLARLRRLSCQRGEKEKDEGEVNINLTCSVAQERDENAPGRLEG